jgi:arginine exporter protein ArgO
VGLYARVTLLLGGFLLAAGLVYGTTNYERRGLVLLLVAAGGFIYLGLYARRAVRAADRANREAPEAEPSPPPAEGHEIEEVRPTIWPLVFSLAGAGLVAGVLASHWILFVAGLLAVAAAAGWFLEVLVQRQQHR